jgi:serine/threonine protein kinase
LIFIPEASIAIYPDRIVLSAKRKENSLSAVETTISVHESDVGERCIPFKSDLAFKIDEKRHRVSLIAIASERLEFEFTVEKASQLIIVQEILRRKLCELGFEEKFRVVRELGKGATAKVYLVERVADGRAFAAKVISIREASNKDYVLLWGCRRRSRTRRRS